MFQNLINHINPSLFFLAHACFSKSEYVIYKLKEMGRIGEKDILEICNQFSKLDPNNSGKITLPDLLQNRLQCQKVGNSIF